MKSEPRRGSEWLKQRNRARETKVEPLAAGRGSDSFATRVIFQELFGLS